jgi:serine/threonine protein phosphatase PrpC
MTGSGETPACPEHGPPAAPEHRFCEECGRNLRTGEPAPAVAVPVPAPRPAAVPTPGPGAVPPGPTAVPAPRLAARAPAAWLSSRAPAGGCAGCGTTAPGTGDYCDHCGRRRSAGRDRAELALTGVAGVTDRARRRHNEDAVALSRLAEATLALVCDGVSTSRHADLAAQAGVEAGIGALREALAGGAPAAEATTLAAETAAGAVRAVARPDDGDAPPSCTYVSAVVEAGAVTIGWIGDSRAYWLSPVPGDSACLTVDDSVAGQVAAGRPVPAGAGDDPTSRALIRWLGADFEEAKPQVVTLRPPGPGRVLLCSDGLHHYLSDPEALARVAPGPETPPLDVARTLTRIALEAGGHDNIAVAVLPFPPVRPEAPPAQPEPLPVRPEAPPAQPEPLPVRPEAPPEAPPEALPAQPEAQKGSPA